MLRAFTSTGLLWPSFQTTAWLPVNTKCRKPMNSQLLVPREPNNRKQPAPPNPKRNKLHTKDRRVQGWAQSRTQADLVGGMRYRFAMNPMLHRTILRKSINCAYVHLRGNKSKLGLEAWVITLHRYGTNKQCGT